jgi:DNA-binding transcriptional ArsR family regulator
MNREEEIGAMAELFHQMADSTRLELLLALSDGEKCVCDLAENARVSVSAVSHQLRSLKMARLVRSRRDGRHVYYSLDDDHVQSLVSLAGEHIRE